MAERRREHHTLVHELLGQGMKIRQIATHLGWGRHTVQRYARAETWQQMLVGTRRPRPSTLDPYKAHLQAGYTGLHGNMQAWIAGPGLGGELTEKVAPRSLRGCSLGPCGIVKA
jgi:uncharacterized protein YjcR